MVFEGKSPDASGNASPIQGLPLDLLVAIFQAVYYSYPEHHRQCSVSQAGAFVQVQGPRPMLQLRSVCSYWRTAFDLDFPAVWTEIHVDFTEARTTPNTILDPSRFQELLRRSKSHDLTISIDTSYRAPSAATIPFYHDLCHSLAQAMARCRMLKLSRREPGSPFGLPQIFANQPFPFISGVVIDAFSDHIAHLFGQFGCDRLAQTLVSSPSGIHTALALGANVTSITSVGQVVGHSSWMRPTATIEPEINRRIHSISILHDTYDPTLKTISLILNTIRFPSVQSLVIEEPYDYRQRATDTIWTPVGNFLTKSQCSLTSLDLTFRTLPVLALDVLLAMLQAAPSLLSLALREDFTYRFGTAPAEWRLSVFTPNFMESLVVKSQQSAILPNLQHIKFSSEHHFVTGCYPGRVVFPVRELVDDVLGTRKRSVLLERAQVAQIRSVYVRLRTQVLSEEGLGLLVDVDKGEERWTFEVVDQKGLVSSRRLSAT